MAYKIVWHQDAADDLLKLEKNIQKQIINRIKNCLVDEPLSLSKRIKFQRDQDGAYVIIHSIDQADKPLTGIFKGLYRYRYGDYRIIYSIDKLHNTVTILRIGHRKDIHDNWQKYLGHEPHG